LVQQWFFNAASAASFLLVEAGEALGFGF